MFQQSVACSVAQSMALSWLGLGHNTVQQATCMPRLAMSRPCLGYKVRDICGRSLGTSSAHEPRKNNFI